MDNINTGIEEIELGIGEIKTAEEIVAEAAMAAMVGGATEDDFAFMSPDGSEKDMLFRQRGNDDGCFFLQNGRVSACSVVGPRKQNEDSVGYESYMGYDILAIADGVGGAPYGEVASSLATKTFIRAAKKLLTLDTHPHEVIVRATYTANRAINNVIRAFPDTHDGMCTTFIGAIVKGREVYLVHIGDSRAYVVSPTDKKQTIRQITKDHALFGSYHGNYHDPIATQALSGNVVDDFDAFDALTEPKQDGEPFWNSGYLSRVLGDMVIQPDYFTFTLSKTDVLLLCTDGVSNAIRTEEIGRAVAQAHVREGTADAVVDAVAQARYVDNTTALAMHACPVVGNMNAKRAKGAKGAN